jgi:Glyoxalase-like domain
VRETVQRGEVHAAGRVDDRQDLPEVPQQLHLDTTVPTAADLAIQHERALALGARLLLDRSDDPGEPLYVYADPAGHPFCIFVA